MNELLMMGNMNGKIEERDTGGGLTGAEFFSTFFLSTSVGILYSYLYQNWCMKFSSGRNTWLGREFFYLLRRTKFNCTLDE